VQFENFFSEISKGNFFVKKKTTGVSPKSRFLSEANWDY
jgi:hypothetical protein